MSCFDKARESCHWYAVADGILLGGCSHVRLGIRDTLSLPETGRDS